MALRQCIAVRILVDCCCRASDCRTFTTSYNGTLTSSPTVARGHGQAPTAGPRWEATATQINRGLLTSRDPILYYDELALYESELDDHGSSRLGVKVGALACALAMHECLQPICSMPCPRNACSSQINKPTALVQVRVMPRCWYVLVRFWLRVDHVMVRLREVSWLILWYCACLRSATCIGLAWLLVVGPSQQEFSSAEAISPMTPLSQTRVFCEFGSTSASPPVLREVRFHEGTFRALRTAGAPAEGPAYADADSAAAALMAVAPVGVTHYRLEQLQLSLAEDDC